MTQMTSCRFMMIIIPIFGKEYRSYADTAFLYSPASRINAPTTHARCAGSQEARPGPQGELSVPLHHARHVRACVPYSYAGLR